MVRRLIFTLALLASTSSVAKASQVAFDYIGSNSTLVGSILSVQGGGGANYQKYAMMYQPSQAETIDHFSSLMLGGMPGTDSPPNEANWELLHYLWRLQIWSVPATAPPVDTQIVGIGVIPAIVNEYWQTQPDATAVPGNYNLEVYPVGGVPTRDGLSPSGKQRWLADFEVSSHNVLLDPSRTYMFELSVIENTNAPYIYIFETNLAGPPGARVFKGLSGPGPVGLNYPLPTPALRMTTQAVPEPASWLLFAVGGVGIGLARWRLRYVSHSSQRGR
ncbi:MAG: PEP-CTERM sorting domain-containing protein [Planctomycetota bacterium]|nr:PEP-CTERM sorting domain-containing protein [Planctomycetota bacterium]